MCTRLAPSTLRGPQGVPAVREQHPRDRRRRRWSRRRTRRRPGPAAGPADSGRERGAPELTSSSESGAPSASTTSPVACAARIGTRSERPLRAASAAASASSNGTSTYGGHRRGADREVLGQHADPPQLGRPLGGREPGELEDDAVDGGQAWPRRRRTAGARTWARTPRAATSMSTAVAGWRAGRPRRAGRRRRRRRSSSPRRASDAAGSCRDARPTAYAASSAEARLAPSRPSRAGEPAGFHHVERKRGAPPPAPRPGAARTGSGPPGAAARRAGPLGAAGAC